MLACLATAGLLAGCGNATSGSASPAPAAAPVSTSPAPTRFESVALMNASLQQSTMQSAAAHMLSTISSGGQVTTMNGDFRLDKVVKNYAFDFVLTQPDPKTGTSEIHEVILPEGIYLEPKATATSKAPTRWLKLNTASSDPHVKTLVDLQNHLQRSMDFSDTMPNSATITKTSPEQLDGIPTTRYDVTVDVMAAIKNARDATEQQQFAQLRGEGLTTLNASIWVDADNRPRKLHSDLPLSKVGKPGAADVAMDTTLSDWGKPVSITAPPADQVTLFPKN